MPLSKPRIARWVRVIVVVALLSAAAFFFRDHLGFIRQGVVAVRDAQPGWVAVACVLCAVSFVAMSEVMVVLLRSAGVKVRRRQALGLVLAANAWSNSLPAGPTLSTVLQVRVQRSWGASLVIIGWFVVLSSALSTLWLVLLGLLAVFFFDASFSASSLLGMGAIALAATGAVFAISHHPRVLTKLPLLGSEKTVHHIEQLHTVSLSFARFLLAATLSLLNRLSDLFTLWVALIAILPEAPHIAGVALAFLTAKIVGATGITPGGLGPLEAALTAALVATGIPATAALAGVLVYRMISFIGATAIGWVSYALITKETP
ncbi:YbhN family protein [Staphylococcus chromogenes]|nr:YbhN family protein [Staphylococcus chromogenes]